jgi:hypothetical protein
MSAIDKDGYIITNGIRHQFHLFISPPIYNNEGDDYYCLVELTDILSEETRIYGLDAKQATLLATHFVKQLLEDSKIVDRNGVPIEL